MQAFLGVKKVDPLEIYRVVITRSASLPWKAHGSRRRPNPQNTPETPVFRVFRWFSVGSREGQKNQKKSKKKVSRGFCRPFFWPQTTKKGVLDKGMYQQTKKVRRQRQKFFNVFYRFFSKISKKVKKTESHFFRSSTKSGDGTLSPLFFAKKKWPFFLCTFDLGKKPSRFPVGAGSLAPVAPPTHFSYQPSHDFEKKARFCCIAPKTLFLGVQLSKVDLRTPPQTGLTRFSAFAKLKKCQLFEKSSRRHCGLPTSAHFFAMYGRYCGKICQSFTIF